MAWFPSDYGHSCGHGLNGEIRIFWEALPLALVSFIIYALLVIASIAAWINTKIILEEIDKIKKHIGIPEDKPIGLPTSRDNLEEDDNQKEDVT